MSVADDTWKEVLKSTQAHLRRKITVFGFLKTATECRKCDNCKADLTDSHFINNGKVRD